MNKKHKVLIIYMVCYVNGRKENMKEKKVVLKKVNRTNNSTVRTLACHCSCEGSGIRAVGKGYIAGFF